MMIWIPSMIKAVFELPAAMIGIMAWNGLFYTIPGINMVTVMVIMVTTVMITHNVSPITKSESKTNK